MFPPKELEAPNRGTDGNDDGDLQRPADGCHLREVLSIDSDVHSQSHYPRAGLGTRGDGLPRVHD